ncbi:unnamed protein product [Heterosigma akashiwo]
MMCARGWSLSQASWHPARYGPGFQRSSATRCHLFGGVTAVLGARPAGRRAQAHGHCGGIGNQTHSPSRHHSYPSRQQTERQRQILRSSRQDQRAAEEQGVRDCQSGPPDAVHPDCSRSLW